jgi:hypothetical protein
MGIKVRIQVIVEHDDGYETELVEEVGCLQRGDLLPESLGMSLDEGKQLLANMQRCIVQQQIEAFIAKQRYCGNCGWQHRRKEHKSIVMRTVFGKLQLESPRLYTCVCQQNQKRSFSPLADRLPERTTPELKYLQTKWASLMSYGLTTDILEEVLPIQANTKTIRRQVHQVAEKMEAELGAEQPSFVEGIFMIWDQLPEPDPPLTVGIDGGFVHAREGDNRKAGWFEVIVGKSIPEIGDTKRFAFVNKFDEKPKRRLYETLKTQGLAMHQEITFLSDGGDTVRNLQAQISPYAEHILDWFHVTMRITMMRQMAQKFLTLPGLANLDLKLESVKWYLWHGNVFRAQQHLRWIYMDLEVFEEEDIPHKKQFRRLCRAVDEFETYITLNEPFIPNYGERHSYGEPISTAFVESTVNEVISRRMVKKQQMRWTQKGAHLLLQVRTRALNDDLKDTFCRWYPGMVATSTSELPLAV